MNFKKVYLPVFIDLDYYKYIPQYAFTSLEKAKEWVESVQEGYSDCHISYHVLELNE